MSEIFKGTKNTQYPGYNVKGGTYDVNEEASLFIDERSRVYFGDVDLETQERFLLPHGIDRLGNCFSYEKINGFVPFPNNSKYLQVLEKFRFDNKIDFSNIKTFIECGSAAGQTSRGMSQFFNVKSIEIYNGVQCCLPGLKYDIEWIEGDGTGELTKYVANNPNERLLVLLDDHTSAPDYKTWIIQQIISIATNSKNKDHVIIIDDYDHYAVGGYPLYLEIINFLRQINPNYIIEEHGMLDILPNSYCHVCYVPKVSLRWE